MRLKRQLFRPGRRIEQIGKLASHPFFSRRGRVAIVPASNAGVPSATASRPFLARAAENVGALFSIAISVVLLAAIVALTVAFVKEVRREAVYLDPLDVPKDLSDRGFTPAVATERLLDEIRAIQAQAGTAKLRQGIDATAAQVDIQAPGGQLSMKSIVRYVHHLLDFPETHLTGEITRQGPELQILLRSRDRASITTGTLHSAPDVAPLLRQGAEEALYLTDPYVLAAHLIEQEEPVSGFPRTVAALQRVLATPPATDDAWAWNLWGNLLVRQGKNSEAIDKYRRAVALDPFGNGFNGLLNTMREQGQRDQAQRLLDEAAVAAKTPYHHGRLGWAYTLHGQCDLALEQLKQALAGLPDDREVRLGIGICQLNSHRYADALQTMNDYARRFPAMPDRARGFGMYSELLVKSGHLEDAEEIVETMIARYPTSYPTAYGTAFLRLAQRRYTAAKDAALLSLKTDPDDPAIVAVLGEALLQLGDANAAIERVAAKPKDSRRDPDTYVVWARALAARGKRDAALAKFDEAAKLDPAHARTYIEWSALLAAMGRDADAAEKHAKGEALAKQQGLVL